MIDFFTSLWNGLHETWYGQAILYSWIAALAVLLAVSILYAIPTRHQRWLAPILAAPAAIISFVSNLVLRFLLPLAAIGLILMGIGGWISEEDTVLGALREGAPPLLLAVGGFFLASTSSILITERAKQFAQAEHNAKQARLAQRITDDEL